MSGFPFTPYGKRHGRGENDQQQNQVAPNQIPPDQPQYPFNQPAPPIQYPYSHFAPPQPQHPHVNNYYYRDPPGPNGNYNYYRQPPGPNGNHYYRQPPAQHTQPTTTPVVAQPVPVVETSDDENEQVPIIKVERQADGSTIIRLDSTKDHDSDDIIKATVKALRKQKYSVTQVPAVATTDVTVTDEAITAFSSKEQRKLVKLAAKAQRRQVEMAKRAEHRQQREQRRQQRFEKRKQRFQLRKQRREQRILFHLLKKQAKLAKKGGQVAEYQRLIALIADMKVWLRTQATETTTTTTAVNVDNNTATSTDDSSTSTSSDSDLSSSSDDDFEFGGRHRHHHHFGHFGRHYRHHHGPHHHHNALPYPTFFGFGPQPHYPHFPAPPPHHHHHAPQTHQPPHHHGRHHRHHGNGRGGFFGGYRRNHHPHHDSQSSSSDSETDSETTKQPSQSPHLCDISLGDFSPTQIQQVLGGVIPSLLSNFPFSVYTDNDTKSTKDGETATLNDQNAKEENAKEDKNVYLDIDLEDLFNPAKFTKIKLMLEQLGVSLQSVLEANGIEMPSQEQLSGELSQLPTNYQCAVEGLQQATASVPNLATLQDQMSQQQPQLHDMLTQFQQLFQGQLPSPQQDEAVEQQESQPPCRGFGRGFGFGRRRCRQQHHQVEEPSTTTTTTSTNTPPQQPQEVAQPFHGFAPRHSRCQRRRQQQSSQEQAQSVPIGNTNANPLFDLIGTFAKAFGGQGLMNAQPMEAHQQEEFNAVETNNTTTTTTTQSQPNMPVEASVAEINAQQITDEDEFLALMIREIEHQFLNQSESVDKPVATTTASTTPLQPQQQPQVQPTTVGDVVDETPVFETPTSTTTITTTPLDESLPLIIDIIDALECEDQQQITPLSQAAAVEPSLASFLQQVPLVAVEDVPTITIPTVPVVKVLEISPIVADEPITTPTTAPAIGINDLSSSTASAPTSAQLEATDVETAPVSSTASTTPSHQSLHASNQVLLTRLFAQNDQLYKKRGVLAQKIKTAQENTPKAVPVLQQSLAHIDQLIQQTSEYVTQLLSEMDQSDEEFNLIDAESGDEQDQ